MAKSFWTSWSPHDWNKIIALEDVERIWRYEPIFKINDADSLLVNGIRLSMPLSTAIYKRKFTPGPL